MKKIKVALLIDEFFGGAGTAFGGYGFLARKYIAKYIPGKDLQIDVLLELDKKLEEASAEKVDNVMVYRLPGDKQKAKDWLKSQKYDLYLSIEMTWPSHEIMELVEDKNLVLWIQDPRPEKFWETKRNSMSVIQDPCVCDKKVSDLIRKMNYQGRVKFISQGYSLNPLAQELYGLQDDFPVDYVPNPIEIDFNFEFDLSKKKKQVIFLGRLEAQKRAWLFCEIAKKMPEYDFYVMGKFFRYEDENKKILEPYMNDNIQNLHFMGHMDGEEKEQLIKESRVLLNTSIWEGIPISWLECLQYGTTVVSCLNNENLPSRFGSFVGEVNGDGFESADLFVPAIKKLMEDDEYYKEKAVSAIKYIRENHNIERFKDTIVNTIRKHCRINIKDLFQKWQYNHYVKKPYMLVESRNGKYHFFSKSKFISVSGNVKNFQHNIIDISSNAKLKKKLHVAFVGTCNNNYISIKKTEYYNCIHFYIYGNNSCVKIGREFSSGGVNFQLLDSNCLIEIGDNVMCASGIQFYPSDAYAILNEKEEITNSNKPIIIQDNVWVASNVIILKGTVIPKGCVIGARSLVNRHYDVPNSLIVNDKIVKQNIYWKRESPSLIEGTFADYKKSSNVFKYFFYRIMSNLTIGKTKQKFLEKKKLYGCHT